MNRDMQIRKVREMRAGESAIVGFFFFAEWDVQFFVSVRLSISRIKIMAGRSVVNEIEKREFDFRTVKNVN